MKKAVWYTGVMWVLAGAISCQQVDPIEVRIEREIQNKMDRFMEKKNQACRDYVVDEAEKYVDSILYLEIGLTLQTGEFPGKPTREGDTLNYDIKIDTLYPEKIVVDSAWLE